MRKLTAKQKRFIEEYLIDLNATKAAVRAGYSAKTAAEIGRQNLRKLEIAAAIEKSMAGLAERAKLPNRDVEPSFFVRSACYTGNRNVKNGQPGRLRWTNGADNSSRDYRPSNATAGESSRSMSSQLAAAQKLGLAGFRLLPPCFPIGWPATAVPS
jgi:hypothetical protein